MTAIQAGREKAKFEKEGREADLEERTRDNKARRRNDKRQTDIKYGQYELEKDLQGFKKAENVSKQVKNYAGSAKDLTGVAGGIASIIAAANDWQWYFSDYQRMADVTTLPQFVPYGELFNFNSSEEQSSVVRSTSAAPGILAFETAQTVGFAEGPDSAIQRAAESIFDFVNAHTGRNSNYEASDILMVSLAFASLDAFSLHLKRAYRCCSITDPLNDYLPRHLVEVMGFDYEDMIAHKLEYRALINYIEDMKFKYLTVPHLPIRERWCYEMAHVFADTPNTAVQQFYLYIPRHFFKLKIGDAAATSLEVKIWNESVDGFITKKSIEDVRAYANDLISGFANMADAKQIKADMINAFGDSAKYEKVYLTEDEPEFAFTIDNLSLLQFQNANICYKKATDTAYEYTITQDENGYIDSHPAGSNVSFATGIKRMPIVADGIDKMTDAQKNVLTVEATRLMQMPRIKGDSETNRWWLNSPAASVLNKMYLFVRQEDPTNPYASAPIDYITITSLEARLTGDEISKEAFALLTLLNSFDWAPKRWATAKQYINEEAPDALTTFPIFGWDQALVIDDQQLKSMNETIALRLFGVVE